MITEHKRKTRTFSSIFPGLNDEYSNREFLKDWRLGINFRPVDTPKIDKAYTFQMEIPGLQKEDLRVEVTDEKITIIAETMEFITDNNEEYEQKELIRHLYQRSYDIPEGVNTGEVDVTYKDDVLSLTLYKMEQ